MLNTKLNKEYKKLSKKYFKLEEKEYKTFDEKIELDAIEIRMAVIAETLENQK